MYLFDYQLLAFIMFRSSMYISTRISTSTILDTEEFSSLFILLPNPVTPSIAVDLHQCTHSTLTLTLPVLQHCSVIEFGRKCPPSFLNTTRSLSHHRHIDIASILLRRGRRVNIKLQRKAVDRTRQRLPRPKRCLSPVQRETTSAYKG